MSENIKGKCTSGSSLSTVLGHAPFLPAKGARANSLPQPLQILFPTCIDSGFYFHTCNLAYVNLSRWD